MQRSLVLLFAALLVAALPGMAQYRAKAEIPFPFIYENAAYPAGKWEFQQLGSNYLSARTAREGLIVMGQPAYDVRGESIGRALLVFHRYGGQHFLAQVWTGGEAGLVLAPCREERRLQVAGARREKDAVVLARLR